MQTGPRPGRRAVGVPIGGAADLDSYTLANVALGIELDPPTYEFGLAHAEMMVEVDGAVAIVGADADFTINARAGQTNAVEPVQRGDRIVLSLPRNGVYVYVAHRAGSFAARRLDRRAFRSEIRYLPLDGAPKLDGNEFTVSAHSNRLGVRLQGQFPSHLTEKPSEPMTPGAIQWTPSGELIVIGPDGPTIGGYPVLGAIIEADFADLFQTGPRETVRFVSIGLDEVWHARQGRSKTLRQIRASLRLGGLR